jgi:anti-anti-sigma regulatory factor
MDSHLSVAYHRHHAVLHLTGVIDNAATDEITRRVDDAVSLGCTRLEVDVAAVTSIGDGPLRALGFAKMRMAQSGRSLVVRGTASPQPRVTDTTPAPVHLAVGA